MTPTFLKGIYKRTREPIEYYMLQLSVKIQNNYESETFYSTKKSYTK